MMYLRKRNHWRRQAAQRGPVADQSLLRKKEAVANLADDEMVDRPLDVDTEK